MKNVITSLLLLAICVSGYSQDAKKIYLGIGTGLNYPTGIIGGSLEVQLVKNLTAFGSLGLGSWGGKVGAGLRIYPSYPGKFAFGIGYSYASGIDDVELEMEEEFVYGGSGVSTVTFNLLPSSTINISAIKHWLIGKEKKNRIGIEAGYAIPTANDRFQSEATLTRQGRTFMNILQPGGFMIGTTFSFGL
jgi:hypothetical protein